MEILDHIYVKIGILLMFLLVLIYTLASQTKHYDLQERLKMFYETFNSSQIAEILKKISAVVAVNTTILVTNRTTTTTSTASVTSTQITTITTIISTTSSTGRPTTIDPAELLSERPPSASQADKRRLSNSLVAFVFQTQHHVLADLQMYLLRRLGKDLVAIELFLDGSATPEMKAAAERNGAILHPSPADIHPANAGPSDRNTDIVNWAISTRAKRYLGNGTAVLLLDGDVFPLSPFDSVSLLSAHDLICRKHPAEFARYCWIGFICLGPELYNTIGDFNVSQDTRNGKAYDSGGKTAEFLVKYENTSYSYMRETIFLQTDKSLFWGAMDEDIQWIGSNFGRCDKCGPEIFFSPFKNCDAVFYHMISATSEWRFGHQGPRRQSLRNAVMRSPYGPNQTLAMTDMMASVKKVQKMDVIPIFGNLTCVKICGR